MGSLLAYPRAVPGFIESVRQQLLEALRLSGLRQTDVSREAKVANSSLNGFLNGKRGMELDGLDRVFKAIEKLAPHAAKAIMPPVTPPPRDDLDARIERAVERALALRQEPDVPVARKKHTPLPRTHRR